MSKTDLPMTKQAGSTGLYSVDDAYEYEYDYFEPSPVFEKNSLREKARERAERPVRRASESA